MTLCAVPLECVLGKVEVNLVEDVRIGGSKVYCVLPSDLARMQERIATISSIDPAGSPIVVATEGAAGCGTSCTRHYYSTSAVAATTVHGRELPKHGLPVPAAEEVSPAAPSTVILDGATRREVVRAQGKRRAMRLQLYEAG